MNRQSFSLPRRRFVQCLALGATALGLGLNPRQLLATQGHTGAPILSGDTFHLTLGGADVNITGKLRQATTINGIVPGPTLRWREGDTVTIKVTNDHPEDKPCDMYLSYTKYEVKIREFDETENDDYFGLSEKTGVTGTLHVFSNLGSKPGVVPDDDEQARCYAKLMEAVHITVTGDNLFGNTLASLLGL